MVVHISNVDPESLPYVVVGAILLAGFMRLFKSGPVQPPASPQPVETVPTESPLEPIIARARTDLTRGLTARLGYPVRSTSHGAVHLSPANLAVFLIVDTDSQRDQIKALPDLDARFREALSTAGYPRDSVYHPHLAVESEETVQRDWAGNWWHYMK